MTSAALRDLIAGAWISQAVFVAAKLGIADLLETGPQAPAELAERTGANEDALCRLMRALASIGLFAEDEKGRFALTPLGSGLRGNAPGSLKAFSTFCGESWHWRPWGELLHSVRTGQSAFEHVFGRGMFDYLAEHPEAALINDAAMTSSGALQNSAVAGA